MDKYTDKYINKFDILKHAIVGFEFEFYCDRPYYKLLELLNRELDPVKVSGYRVYHSSFEPTPDHWKIEPDLSMGWDGIELVTGPLKYVDAKIYLLKVLKILQGPLFRTDDKCSLHINISFDKETSPKTLENLNKLKLILEVDENLVYKYFPERKNNFYAKSVKRLIPFKNFDFAGNAIDILVNSIELPDTKYYGINILNVYNGRLEFRYIGSEGYQKRTFEILHLMDYFIELTWNCINETLTNENLIELEEYLSKNINQFKNFLTLDNFIAEFPSVELQIDQNSDLIIVKTYYNQIYDKLYEIITNIYNLNNCIINYNTQNKKLELVDASFKTIFDIKNIDIIDCVIDGGSFSNCIFLNCEIKNAHLNKCQLISTDVYNSKVESCKIIEGSILHDCYVDNCFLNAEMRSGVFRSGKLGEYGEIGKDVKIVTPKNSYFSNDKSMPFEDKLDYISDFKNQTNNKNKWIKGK